MKVVNPNEPAGYGPNFPADGVEARKLVADMLADRVTPSLEKVRLVISKLTADTEVERLLAAHPEKRMLVESATPIVHLGRSGALRGPTAARGVCSIETEDDHVSSEHNDITCPLCFCIHEAVTDAGDDESKYYEHDIDSIMADDEFLTDALDRFAARIRRQYARAASFLNNDIIVEVSHQGRTIKVQQVSQVRKHLDGEYLVFVDDELRHPHCSAEDVMRALGHYLHEEHGLRETLRLLAEDWKSRSYNVPYSNPSPEQFARNDGREDAFREAAEAIEDALKGAVAESS